MNFITGCWRALAHDMFDLLWLTGKMTRSEAYEWLSDMLQLPKCRTHISLFDEEQCKKAIKLSKEKIMSNHITTGKVRLSYANLFEPYAQRQDQEPKYSVTILVPKTDAATKTRIDAAVEAAKQSGAAKWGGTIPPKVDVCVHDGDGPRPSDGMPYGEECKGHWVFTASSKRPPKVVDLNLNPIIDQNEIYSGCYGRVSVDFYPYNASGKKGIGCGLQNVQKVADGDPLGNNYSVEDDFAEPIPQEAFAFNPFAI